MSSYSGVAMEGGGSEGEDARAGEGPRRRGASSSALSDLAEVFGLLSDPGRLRLIVALVEAERCVGDLAVQAGLSESATSHALRILRAHRVVTVRREGRMAYYSLHDAHVRTLLDVALAHIAHTQMVHDHPVSPDD